MSCRCVNSFNSIAATSACTGHRLVLIKYIIRTQRPFHFSHDTFDAILKMLAHLSPSIFTSKSNNCNQIGHGILLYNFHKYCMIYRLPMLEKLMNKMRDTVCRNFFASYCIKLLHLGYCLSNICASYCSKLLH